MTWGADTKKIASKSAHQFDIRYKRCGPISFTCDDPDKKIHFKFDRFHTEINYDYFFIGYPETSKNYTIGRAFF